VGWGGCWLGGGGGGGGNTLILGDYFGIFWTLVLETQLTAFHSRFITKSYLLLVTSLLLASADII